jgi:glutamate synthase (NADPH/NADH) large chain
MTLRGIFTFKDGVPATRSTRRGRARLEIVRRFSTGAMSYGSISQEAHETTRSR